MKMNSIKLYLFFSLLFLWVSSLHGESLQLDKLKANFLLGICDFSKWDPPVEGKKIVGVVGEENLFRELQKLLENSDDLASDYRIVSVSSSSNLSGLHAIYIGDEEEDVWIEILKEHATLPVIKMGSSDKFFEACGTIQFQANNNRLTFSINMEGIPNGVKLSSKLLHLSRND